jgi:glycosyltransferase involved in cell wall biosynthesis
MASAYGAARRDTSDSANFDDTLTKIASSSGKSRVEAARVLHVIDSFDLGGAQTALRDLIGATDRTRFAPEVAAMHGRGVFYEDFRALGIPVHSLSLRKWLPLYVPALAALILRRRPHIVHCHLFGSNWIAKPLAALLGVPVRISHDQCNDALRYESRAARWFDALTNRLSTHICAVSRSTRDFLVQREGLPPERVSVVYNGVDLERFDPERANTKRDPAHPLIAGVGRLHPQKDFGLFLEVAARLVARHPAIRFIIAGDGPETAMLQTKARALGLAERVRFAGHISDMREIYAAADALLLTSRYEGTPLTVLEAMAMRVPVVASRLDGIAEVITDGEDGFLVGQGDVDGFADRVTRLLADSQLRHRIADAARRRVETTFSAAAMAAQVEAIYARCLDA